MIVKCPPQSYRHQWWSSPQFLFGLFLLLGILSGHFFMSRRHGASPAAATRPAFPFSRQADEIHLITQLYEERDVVRRGELMRAACQNLNNPLVTRIHFLDSLSVRNAFQQFQPHCNLTLSQFNAKARFYPASSTKKGSKVGPSDGSNRLTAGAAFAFANRYLPGKTVILSNADIYFDGTLRHLRTDRWLSLSNMYFLSRYEPDEDVGLGTQCGANYIGSHDAFVFVPPVPKPLVARTMGLALGTPGVENRMIHDFRAFGIGILNPCLTIRSWHLHRSRVRTLGIPPANTDHRSGIARPMRQLTRPPTLDELAQ